MRRVVIIATLALAFGGVAIAVAQEGGGAPEDAGGPTADCAEVTKAGGEFGRCVSEAASAFGKCVSDAAKAEGGKPTEACADLKPGKGHSGDEDDGDTDGDEPLAQGGGGAASNPTTGLTKPPEQAGRDFGQQVAANARGEHGPPDHAGSDSNPNAGLTKPPAQAGRDFGGQVSDTANGDHGPPGG